MSCFFPTQKSEGKKWTFRKAINKCVEYEKIITKFVFSITFVHFFLYMLFVIWVPLHVCLVLYSHAHQMLIHLLFHLAITHKLWCDWTDFERLLKISHPNNYIETVDNLTGFFSLWFVEMPSCITLANENDARKKKPNKMLSMSEDDWTGEWFSSEFLSNLPQTLKGQKRAFECFETKWVAF